jgi:hypothetical protein
VEERADNVAQDLDGSLGFGAPDRLEFGKAFSIG